MTEENKKTNSAQEFARAEDCLKSAELLASHSQYADAAQRKRSS